MAHLSPVHAYIFVIFWASGYLTVNGTETNENGRAKVKFLPIVLKSESLMAVLHYLAEFAVM